MPLCNGDRTSSKHVDDNTNAADGHEHKVELHATASNDTTSASTVVDVNERLCPSSVTGDCHGSPSTDAEDISSSRSFTNDASLSSSEASSLPQFAPEEIGRSVVAQL